MGESVAEWLRYFTGIRPSGSSTMAIRTLRQFNENPQATCGGAHDSSGAN
jgi:hypothetical protein